VLLCVCGVVFKCLGSDVYIALSVWYLFVRRGVCLCDFLCVCGFSVLRVTVCCVC